MTQPTTAFHGWRMVGLAFLAQSIAIGLTFGVYGTWVAALEQSFGISRTLSASGLALVLLTKGLLSPLVGPLLGRWSIRRTMIAGAILMAVGHALLALADSILLALAAYGLVVGAGVCLLGVLPAQALVTNWFISRRGKALGLTMMPLVVFLAPALAAWSNTAFGWRNTALAVAVICLAAIPALRRVVDHPRQIGQVPLRDADSAVAPTPTAVIDAATLLANWRFWAVSLIAGLAFSASTMLATHLVPMAAAGGVSYQQAALALSVMGGSGILGAFLVGVIGDRIGPAYAYALNVSVQIALWGMLLTTPTFSLLLATAAAIGLCGGGMSVTQACLLGALFGPASFAKASGLVTFITMPFTFGAAPLAGLLFDRTGSYEHAITLHMVLFAIAAVGLLIVAPRRLATAVA